MGQPDPFARLVLRARSPEKIENPLVIARIDAAAVVRDGDLHPPVIVPGRAVSSTSRTLSSR